VEFKKENQGTPRLPILVSIPHGGTEVPDVVRQRTRLDARALSYYSDPLSLYLYDLGEMATATVTTPVSRVIVDLNRPPYHLPPRYPDGVVKTMTSLGLPVWKEGQVPDLSCIHALLLRHYFPYHAEIDRILLSGTVTVALDCHTMVSRGLPGQPDAGKDRPLFCLSNNGDRLGSARPGALPTCPAEWIQVLAKTIRHYFPGPQPVEINHPFHGGFIVNAHFWHTGIPWIQLEMNRSLYEREDSSPTTGSLADRVRVGELNGVIREIIREWFEKIG